MTGGLENQRGSGESPVRRACPTVTAGGSLLASPSKHKLKSRESNIFKFSAACAGNSTLGFETQPIRSTGLAGTSHAVQPMSTPKKQTMLPFGSPRKQTTLPSPSPKKQTTLPFASPNRFVHVQLATCPVPRQKGPTVARARCPTVVQCHPQVSHVAQARDQGDVARKCFSLISGDVSSTEEDYDDDPPGIVLPSHLQPVAAGTMVDLTAGDASDSEKRGGSRDNVPNHKEAMRAVPQPENGGSSAGIVVEVLSSDDDAAPQQQVGLRAVPDIVQPGVHDKNASSRDNAIDIQQNEPERDSCNGQHPVQRDRQSIPAELDELGGGAEQVAKAPAGIPCANIRDSHAGESHGHAQGGGSQAGRTARGTLAEHVRELATQVSKAQQGDEPAAAGHAHQHVPHVEMHDHAAHQGSVAVDMTQALSGGPNHAKPDTHQKSREWERLSKEDVHDGEEARQQKRKRTQKQSYCSPKYDKKGPMLYHHIARQPFGIGLAATQNLHRRIDREDKAFWQYWVTSVRHRMRQHSMSQQEAHYVFRFEHYRFCLPHSQNALWPSVVEGFILRHREWIQGDATVREVCHAHLLRLTRLHLLAPLQTQHCLKMLNGTHTPCPDYMFDHLRPAEPDPPDAVDGQAEELAEAERQKEEAAVARLAALQQAAAVNSQGLVGIKRPARYAHSAQLPPTPELGHDDGPRGELERLLGDVPTDQVSLRVKRELMRLDNALASKPRTQNAELSADKKPKPKLKIKRRAPAVPVMFRYVSPSEYVKAAKRQVMKGRVLKLSQISRD